VTCASKQRATGPTSPASSRDDPTVEAALAAVDPSRYSAPTRKAENVRDLEGRFGGAWSARFGGAWSARFGGAWRAIFCPSKQVIRSASARPRSRQMLGSSSPTER
jgi:hypothetical protein